MKIGWDEKISQNFRIWWEKWLSLSNNLENLEIPKYYSKLMPRASSLKLHLFCDASYRTYAAHAYVSIVTETDVSVSLLPARSLVAPLKQVSVPRLELQATVLAAILPEQ